MANFANMFFGPLNSDSCIYFFFLTAVFFFILIIILISGILMLIRRPSEFTFRVGMQGFMLFFNIFIAYFTNRLLYTMCNKSLS